MRFRNALFCAALATAGAAAAMKAYGFPRRIGLTRSQASLSLPGDLLIPMADVVVDRAVLVNADPSALWQVLEILFTPSTRTDVLVAQPNDCLVLAVAPTGDQAEEELTGTCTFALLPEANGRTRLHVRERHCSSETYPSWLLHSRLTYEVPSLMRMLHDMKKAAENLRS